MVVEYLNKKYKLFSKSQNFDGKSFDLLSKINSDYSNYKIEYSENNVLKFENGKTAYHSEDEKHIYIFIDGQTFTFNKIDENFDYFEDNSDDSSHDIIKSPMPGSVVNVLVELGQMVDEGTAIVIVSAMKMETTLYSSIAGKVTEVNTVKGEQVDESKPLVVIEKVEN